MHSLLTRLNALVAFMLSVLAAVTFGAFLTTCLNEYTLPVDLTANSVKVLVLIIFDTYFYNIFISFGFVLLYFLSTCFCW